VTNSPYYAHIVSIWPDKRRPIPGGTSTHQGTKRATWGYHSGWDKGVEKGKDPTHPDNASFGPDQINSPIFQRELPPIKSLKGQLRVTNQSNEGPDKY